MHRNGGMEGERNGEGRSECLCVGKKLELKKFVLCRNNRNEGMMEIELEGRKRENDIYILSTSQCQTKRNYKDLQWRTKCL